MIVEVTGRDRGAHTGCPNGEIARVTCDVIAKAAREGVGVARGDREVACVVQAGVEVPRGDLCALGGVGDIGEGACGAGGVGRGSVVGVEETLFGRKGKREKGSKR